MSFVNKGSMPTTVLVSREPDLSGNFVCDGTADDVEIQAAIDYVGVFARGLVHIRQGRYNISAPLVLTGIYNITIEGDGRGRPINQTGGAFVQEGTILMLVTGTDDHLIEMIETAPTKACANKISRLNLHGNAANQTPAAASDCIHLEYVKEFCIENCTVMRAVRYCIGQFSSCENIWIINNMIVQGGDGDSCLFYSGSNVGRIIDNIIMGAVAAGAWGIEMTASSGYGRILGNTITDSSGNITINVSSYIEIIGNSIGAATNNNIFLSHDCHHNSIASNRIISTTNFRGIAIADGGVACTFNLIIGNQILDNNTDGVWLANISDNNAIIDNIITGNGGYGVNISAVTVTNTRVLGNIFNNNASGPIQDLGTATVLHVKTFQFQQGGNAGGIVIGQFIHADASPKGWEIDADAEWAIALGQMPLECQMVVRIKIWAVGLIAPGAGDQMRLEILVNAGGNDEVFTTEAISVVNKNNVTEATAINDVIYWMIDASDDTDIDEIVGGDSVEIKVKHEAAGNGDAATDAVFRSVEIEYV